MGIASWTASYSFGFTGWLSPDAAVWLDKLTSRVLDQMALSAILIAKITLALSSSWAFLGLPIAHGGLLGCHVMFHGLWHELSIRQYFSSFFQRRSVEEFCIAVPELAFPRIRTSRDSGLQQLAKSKASLNRSSPATPLPSVILLSCQASPACPVLQDSAGSAFPVITNSVTQSDAGYQCR